MQLYFMRALLLTIQAELWIKNWYGNSLFQEKYENMYFYVYLQVFYVFFFFWDNRKSDWIKNIRSKVWCS